LKTAVYIPPNPEDMQRSMTEWEAFINSEDEIDPLIKVALIHYQFETIHPFLDGNGRIGRLIIPLFLKEKQLLTHPTLYISYFLKRNRIEYYDRMMEVRLKGNFEQWVQFFLKAVAESAQDAIQTIDLILELHERDLAKVMESKKSLKSTVQVFEYVKRNPIIDIKKTSAEIGVVFNTVAKAVNNLMDLGILKQTENSRRNRCFAYEEYLGILRKDT
jgi:Fic family protein